METAAPSGKFWMPIPMVTEIAANRAISGDAAWLIAPKATPTAKPQEYYVKLWRILKE